jgi:DNA-binding NtrC family response regulator
MRQGTIVVADDELRQREALARMLRESGHRVIVAARGAEAVEAVRQNPVDLVITDLRMPDLDGQHVLQQVRTLQPEVAVIIVTAYGTVAGAVEAMRAGAVDFLTKPIDLDHLELVVARVLERRDLLRENERLRRRLEASTDGFRLIGRSAALAETLARAARAAPTDATVLIHGESGTGKELLARSIHTLSPRAEAPWVAINCAALPETLLESELFGHERGAFTGAVSRRRGRVELAEGGTLFLDEIGDLPAAVQVKLLRFLQEREFCRLGGEETLRADVRVISATHRDLEASMREGSFREDLYYRLNVVRLDLPPLRERREDIPELVEHFVARYAKRHDRPVPAISREAMDALLKYGYPGNVRELENVIEQAIVLSSEGALTVDDLPVGVRSRGVGDEPWTTRPVEGDLPGLLDEIERRIVLETLTRHHGNQAAAARALGVTEGGLRYKLKKWAGGSTHPDS